MNKFTEKWNKMSVEEKRKALTAALGVADGKIIITSENLNPVTVARDNMSVALDTFFRERLNLRRDQKAIKPIAEIFSHDETGKETYLRFPVDMSTLQQREQGEKKNDIATLILCEGDEEEAAG